MHVSLSRRWIADAVGDSDINVRNVATRHHASDYVLRILKEAVSEKRRVLVGFDFAYSYPLQGIGGTLVLLILIPGFLGAVIGVVITAIGSAATEYQREQVSS